MDVIQLIIKDIHIDLPIAANLKVRLKRNQSSSIRFVVSQELQPATTIAKHCNLPLAFQSRVR
jgi:hypothetical protein